VHPLGFPKMKVSMNALSQAMLKICSTVCQTFYGSRDLRLDPFGETYSCSRLAFQIRSFVTNLKSPARIYLIVCQKFTGRVTYATPLLGKLFMHPVGNSAFKCVAMYQISSL